MPHIAACYKILSILVMSDRAAALISRRYSCPLNARGLAERGNLPGRLPDDATMRHYLLGPMAEEARLALTARISRDPELFESLSAFEDELILDFLQGKLSESERQRFVDLYLSAPGGAARVAVMRERERGFSVLRRESRVQTPVVLGNEAPTSARAVVKSGDRGWSCARGGLYGLFQARSRTPHGNPATCAYSECRATSAMLLLPFASSGRGPDRTTR